MRLPANTILATLIVLVFCAFVSDASAQVVLESCGVSSEDALVASCAITRFSTHLFNDPDNPDGPPDPDPNPSILIEAASPENPSGLYLFGMNLGGMAATSAFYPEAARVETRNGLETLIGTGTLQRPEGDSALSYRRVLYATQGTEALQAFYTNAIREFTPKLGRLREAEQFFRRALRVNPIYEDALNGLLETYYARMEGFVLIGNDYMAKTFRNKFDRLPGETQSITQLEIADIESALTSYEQGFREFMKLMKADYRDKDDIARPDLDVDAENLFFEKRFPHPDEANSELVGFEALRGQTTAVGVMTVLRTADGTEVSPVQGSPSLAFDRDAQSEQIAAVSAPATFLIPRIESAPEGRFRIRFEMDIDPANPVQDFELLLEWDSSQLLTPGLDDLNFDPPRVTPVGLEIFLPGEVYNGNTLYGNQALIRFSLDTPISGLDLPIFSVDFEVDASVTNTESLNAYIAGSGGALISGFKDLALLYRLSAFHVNATIAKVKRLYNVASPEESIAEIDKEIARIGGWFTELQQMLEKSAASTDLQNNEQLQVSTKKLASELNALSALREFIRADANVFGYPEDYVPFFDDGETPTVDAVTQLVTGGGAFAPSTAGGFFADAREAETQAILNYDKLKNTKDRIRGELFVANTQIELRLTQIVGLVDGEGNPSLTGEIDVNMRASARNPASEVGQRVILLQRAREVLNQSNADIEQFLEDIELDKQSLAEYIETQKQKQDLVQQYGDMQADLDRQLGKIQAEQTRLTAIANALAAAAEVSGNWTGWITGDNYGRSTANAIRLANGMEQARLEEKKDQLRAQQTEYRTTERVKLAQLDADQEAGDRARLIEAKLNDITVKNIAAQIAELDIQVALGQLNQLVVERDSLLNQRTQAIANLGEMSFADPSFRLTQFGVMKRAEQRLDFLKQWIYVLARAIYYKWAVPDDAPLQVLGLPDFNLSDIQQLQVVGASSDPGVSALQDVMTASDALSTLIAFDQAGPLLSNTSAVQIDRINSNNSARYSLREDFLRIVRRYDSDSPTPQEVSSETARIRSAFTQWLNDPDRLDEEGNLVIEFDTLSHLENYDLPLSDRSWRNFALRAFSNKPLWNHKIMTVGVALKPFGLPFQDGVLNVSGALELGGSGFLKEDSDFCDDFRVYQMRQYQNAQGGGREAINYRTVAITIPSSSSFEATPQLTSELKERPVATSNWRLFIPAEQVANIRLENIVDIYIYINSQAYQRQSNSEPNCLAEESG